MTDDGLPTIDETSDEGVEILRDDRLEAFLMVAALDPVDSEGTEVPVGPGIVGHGGWDDEYLDDMELLFGVTLDLMTSQIESFSDQWGLDPMRLLALIADNFGDVDQQFGVGYDPTSGEVVNEATSIGLNDEDEDEA